MIIITELIVVIAFYENLPVGSGCFKRISRDCVEIKRMYDE